MSELLEAIYRGDKARADELLASDPELDVFEAAAVGKAERRRDGRSRNALRNRQAPTRTGRRSERAPAGRLHAADGGRPARRRASAGASDRARRRNCSKRSLKPGARGIEWPAPGNTVRSAPRRSSSTSQT